MSEAVSFPDNLRRRQIFAAGATVLTLFGAGACGAEESPPKYARGEAHFAVECPGGGQPNIIEVATSGAMPVDPESGKAAAAFVTISCIQENERLKPTVERDEREGACLGYTPSQHHFVVKAEQLGQDEPPEFFVRNDFGDAAEIGVLGIGVGDHLYITKAEIHQHNPQDPVEKHYMTQHGC